MGGVTVWNRRLLVICGLLLLASAINYMDRQTLASVSVRITNEFKLSEQQYGRLEAGFGWAFAIGSLCFGMLADRITVRWLYPAVLVGWSLAGFLTGYAEGYQQLLGCRVLLGFFEAGHWPCGIRTVRGLLSARDRSVGNGLLQSGTSIGAISTPLLMRWLLTPEEGSWRFSFQLIGAIGSLWAIAWLWIVRSSDLPVVRSQKETKTPWWTVFYHHRLWVVLVVVASINTTWQVLRAWLPKFLQQGRGYEESTMLLFNSVWYVATDVGCLSVGVIVLGLVSLGLRLQVARIATFCGCCLLCACTVLVPWLPAGPTLLGVLLIVGAGALGLFPLYYTFSQDISSEHQGKVTGMTSFAAWFFTPFAQDGFGRLVDETKSYDLGFAIAGCVPLIGALALILFWGKHDSDEVQHDSTT